MCERGRKESSVQGKKEVEGVRDREDVKNLVRHGSIEQIAGLAVHNACRFIGGSRGVNDEEIILAVH